MGQAWFMDDDNESDPRLEHHRSPPEFVDLTTLFKLTGFEVLKLDPINFNSDGKLDMIRKQRKYSYEGEITLSRECLPDYDNKLKEFFEEHLHTEEESRFILEGSGYFDVRDPQERWIRFKAVAGDMIIYPAGLYHRFTMDTDNFTKAKLFFVSDQGRVAYSRPADTMECRASYLEKLENGFCSDSITK